MLARDWIDRLVVVLLLVLVLPPGAIGDGPDGAPPDDDTAEANDEALDVTALSLEPPPIRAPVFQAPPLPPQPPPGKGRLSLAFEGNRQWCTYRDDRVVQPPPGVGSTTIAPRMYSPVYTFGYQFSVAAVARSRPDETILLFESQVVRTAVLRQAAKLGRGGKKPPGPTIIAPEGSQHLKKGAGAQEQPSSLVPYWQEQFACTTLPPLFDFDVDPGAYDVYIAFDILGRSGSWTHRSVGYLTEVGVVEGRQTRVDGRVDMIGGGRRQVELMSSALLPGSGAGAAP